MSLAGGLAASGSGYLGATLGAPLYLVSLRAKSLAQPGTTEWFDPPASAPSPYRMNPSPAEQWLRAQALRFNQRLPDRPIEVTWVSDPRLLPRSVNNRVARPDFTTFPAWFDVRETGQGQTVAAALGATSGYFQEYASWAPWVAWQFDYTAAFVDLVAHPSLPPSIRDLLLPYVYASVAITERQVDQLRLHQVHAKHRGTGLEGSWRALQAQIRLSEPEGGFTTEVIDGTLGAIRKELLTQEVKLATKAAAAQRAARSTGGNSAGTSGGNSSSQFSKKGKRRGQPHAAPPPPEA